jgi:hypothetical protein
MRAYEAGLGEFSEDQITIDSDVEPDWESFEPAHLDWAVAWMNRWSKYAWFRRYVLEPEPIFKAGKWATNMLRNIGVVR